MTAALCGVGQDLSVSVAVAQQEWQPTRASVDLQPTSDSTPSRFIQTSNASGLRQLDQAPRPVLSSTEQVGSGVVLRWQTTAPRGAAGSGVNVSRTAAVSPSRTGAALAHSEQANVQINSATVNNATADNFHNVQATYAKIVVPAVNPVQPASHTAVGDQSSPSTAGFDNPLRQSTANAQDSQVLPAAYQQDWSSPSGNQSSQWRSVNARRGQEDANANRPLPEFPGFEPASPAPELGQPSLTPGQPSVPQPFNPLGQPQLQDPSLDLGARPVDPRDQAELPPSPPLALPEKDPPAFPQQIREDVSPADQSQEQIDPSSPLNSNKSLKRDDGEELEELLRRARKAATPNCISQRDMLRGKPLQSISLDVSPKLSEGISSMRSDKTDEDARKEFETKSMLRDWTDYKGNLLASGRLVDLRLGNIVLDIGGSERLIPLSSLSDVDMSYIADLWNLPFRCGTGFEPLEGRNFIASTVQWKASGACHNPLYFEQVQLERYGHEVGPVLQPLISSAHFFLTIPLLPYKMGINPPNECQYSLGYFRPGNCAPYMIQPFPWSLRGGLTQAGAVVSGVAIIP